MKINPKSLENLKPFKPGQSGNPNGQPRKTINSVNKELENRGVSTATPFDIKECFLKLINLSTSELEELCDDDKQPSMIVIVAEAILSGKGFDVIEKMLDRAIGKAEQKTDVTLTDKTINITLNLE